MAATSNIGKIFNGRLALVTGGGSGIGRAVCYLFAEKGANVIVADMNESASKETLKSLTGSPNHHSAHCVNVSKPESVASLFASIREKHSCPPEIVVNCAGITRDALLLDMTPGMFDEVIDVNLKGTFLVTQAACKEMIGSGIRDGSVVNISSITGKVGNMGQANYSSSKAAIVAFTKTVAKEMAGHGIRCNAVVPGFIETPIIQTIPEKVLAMLLKQIPLGRAGTAQEVADVCAFLASGKSSYITGAAIEVGGGIFM